MTKQSVLAINAQNACIPKDLATSLPCRAGRPPVQAACRAQCNAAPQCGPSPVTVPLIFLAASRPASWAVYSCRLQRREGGEQASGWMGGVGLAWCLLVSSSPLLLLPLLTHKIMK